MKSNIIGLILLLTANSLPLIAQKATSLILEKNGEQVLIPLDEWLGVSSANEPNKMFSGIYLGMTVDTLRIQEQGGSFIRNIPLNKIGSIFIDKTKSTKEYVLDGIKLGGLVSIGAGGFITSIFLIESGFDIEALPSIFLFGGLWTVVSGIVTVPVGALIGYRQAQIADENALEYLIGDEQWKIVID
tara:strand:+ start:1709 stop:2269 length:561 start_codon:yes stop_codon:yes gene_type:complete